MALLKDKLWLWGHPEGHYNNDYGNPDISRMTPLEGALNDLKVFVSYEAFKVYGKDGKKYLPYNKEDR